MGSIDNVSTEQETVIIASIHIEEVILSIGHWIGLMGVAVIVIGLIVAGALLLGDLARREMSSEAIEPTFTSVGVLAMIVAVRTFLGWTLAVELEGRWPWQHKESA
jgi:Trk-type K+ transport system membrane component